MQTAGQECCDGFFFLRTKDAREDEAAARTKGRGNLYSGESEDFAEDVGHNDRMAASRFPPQQILFGEPDTAAAVAADVGVRGADGPFVVVEGVDPLGSKFFRGNGQNSGAGADIQQSPVVTGARRFPGKETQAG